MEIASFIAGIPNISDRSLRSRILLVSYCLRTEGQTTFSQTELESAFLHGAVPQPPHLEAVLQELTKGSNAALIDMKDGRFAMSIDGVQEVENYLDSVVGIRPARKSLELLVGRLADPAQVRFLAETIACVQVGAKRAAVTMVWLLTIDHMQKYVLAHHLAAFNASLAGKAGYQNLAIKGQDDFGEIKKESVFIEILRSANIVTNDVRKILDVQLGFRNTCAHPSTVEIPETKVIAAVEDLVTNVVLKYPI